MHQNAATYVKQERFDPQKKQKHRIGAEDRPKKGLEEKRSKRIPKEHSIPSGMTQLDLWYPTGLQDLLSGGLRKAHPHSARLGVSQAQHGGMTTWDKLGNIHECPIYPGVPNRWFHLPKKLYNMLDCEGHRLN